MESTAMASKFFHILDDHTESLRRELHLQWQDNRFCNLRLKVKDGEFRVHACLAAAFSPTLNRLLAEQDKLRRTSSLRTIHLHDFDQATLSPLVKMMYTGMICVDWTEARSVATAARYLALPNVVSYNLELFTSHLDGSQGSLDPPPIHVPSPQPHDASEKDVQSDDLMVGEVGDVIKGERVDTSENEEKREEGGLEYVVVGPNKTIVSILSKPVSEKAPCIVNRRKRKPMRISQHPDKLERSAAEPETAVNLVKVEPSTSPTKEQRRRSGRRRKNFKQAALEERSQMPQTLQTETNFFIADLVSSVEQIEEEEGEARQRQGEGEEEAMLGQSMEEEDCQEDLSRMFWCPHCATYYRRKSNLTRHMRNFHTQEYHLVCRHCKKAVKSERELRVHCRTEHDDPKPFLCDYDGCQYRSYKMDFLRRHQQIHKESKDFVCDKCGRSFSQQAGLWSHRRTCYNTQEYLCDICGQSFNHFQSMKLHRRSVHLREKPYKCKDCSTLFSDHRNLRRHRRIHENAFPYACQQCGNKYRHSNSLKAHMKKHVELGEVLEPLTQSLSGVSMTMIREGMSVDGSILGGFYPGLSVSGSGVVNPGLMTHLPPHIAPPQSAPSYSPPLLPPPTSMHPSVTSVSLAGSTTDSTPLETLANLCFSSNVNV